MHDDFELYLPKPSEIFDTAAAEWGVERCESVRTSGSVVIVGANGSGKTRLGAWIDLHSPQHANVFRISAQKSLAMPDTGNVISLVAAEGDLVYGSATVERQHSRIYKLGHRWGNRQSVKPLDDFNKLMAYLFSEQAQISTKYMADSRESDQRVPPPTTKMSLVKSIWEELLPHRELIIGGAQIETKLKSSEDAPYKSSDMSDGERVLFYLIGQCLATPKDGIIIIDEPELHLHKSLQAPLWAAVERVRNDCLFVYITHDLDFAASQPATTKIWLKSFDGKSWDWDIIDGLVGLPEELLLEILGSRKPIVFVEGDNGSFDVALYRAILSNYLVVPRGSCSSVISEVKALRAAEQFHHINVFGIVDRDRRGDAEIESLEKDGIFVLQVAEVENLFCTKEILAICSHRLARNEITDFEAAQKFAFGKLRSELENQISLRTTAEIKFKLNLLNEKSVGPQALKDALNSLTSSIDIDSLYKENESLLIETIAQNDYTALLKYYNRKSLSSQVSAILDLKEKGLPQLILRIATSEDTEVIKNALTPYFGNFPV